MANSVVVKHRYNHDPRLSANQIAEYLSATPLRRRSILQDAKYPATVMVIRYEDAYAPVVGHMTGTATALDAGIVRLKRKVASEELSEYLEKIASCASTQSNRSGP